MTKRRRAGYAHRRLVKHARRANVVACDKLQRALEARTTQAQATLLCSCSIALAQVSNALAEMQALLNEAE